MVSASSPIRLPLNSRTRVFVLGSIGETGVPGAEIQTYPPPHAISLRLPGSPVSIVASSLAVLPSIRWTVPSDWLNTHIEPSPEAIKRGHSWSLTVDVIVLVLGSIL